LPGEELQDRLPSGPPTPAAEASGDVERLPRGPHMLATGGGRKLGWRAREPTPLAPLVGARSPLMGRADADRRWARGEGLGPDTVFPFFLLYFIFCFYS
jgi:hypothetical protein